MNRDNRFAILLAGIGIGAAVGLLFARYSGLDVQKGADDDKAYIKKRAQTAAHGVESAAETVQEKVGSQVAKGKEAARDIGNRVRHLAAKVAT